MVLHQRSLFATGTPALRADAPVERRWLTDRAWVDVRRGWVDGTDGLLDHLVAEVTWHQGRRHMYDRMVDDPRLSHWCRNEAALPHPVLTDIATALEHDYGVPRVPIGLNYYRSGHDSVAFHADRELRHVDDTVIAIVTLGARRPFLVRPKGGGRSIDLAPAGGDLLVMGGTCQLTQEHCVPKVRSSGPRISATWRAVSPRRSG